MRLRLALDDKLARPGSPGAALALTVLVGFCLQASSPHSAACARAQPKPPPSQPAAATEGQPDVDPDVDPALEQSPGVAASETESWRDRASRVRVGLATDVDVVELPCCQSFVFRVEGVKSGLRVDTRRGPVALRPDPHSVDMGIFRLQVAALKDEQQAFGLAERLESVSAEPGNVLFDAALDLYRVRLGRFSDREQAESAARRLETLGIRDSWVVAEGGHLHDPAIEVHQGGQSRRLEGRRLWIQGEEQPVEFRGQRYRGRLLLFLNSRGRFNVVNELATDDYLRGVLPREMGPALYPRLEALKAQAVAARSYLIRNLEEFADEGYDICATERCQVYGGMTVEHPLSDRAVHETAGEVLVWRDRPADTLYSASCGGRTEAVAVVFPSKDQPYLEGVACPEGGAIVLRGSDEAPGRSLARRLAPPPATGDDLMMLEERLRALASLAGRPVGDLPLASRRADDVAHFVDALFEGESSQAGTEPVEGRELATLLTSGEKELAPADDDRLVVLLALHSGLLERRTAHFLALVDRDRIKLRESREHRVYELAAGWTTSPAPLELEAGDEVEVFLMGDRVVALLAGSARPHPVSPDAEAWVRFRSRSQLRRLVAERYPGFELADLAVVERGESGRVARLRLTSTDGREVTVEGLAIRWTLDLPETWFTVTPAGGAGGGSGWRFEGRGLGHGVGLCQRGAFAMAGLGHDYREILHHYYSGLDLERIEPPLEVAASP